MLPLDVYRANFSKYIFFGGTPSPIRVLKSASIMGGGPQRKASRLATSGTSWDMSSGVTKPEEKVLSAEC